MEDTILEKTAPQVVEKKTSGKAIASLVLGIIALLLWWVPLLGWVPIVLSIIFGFGALKQIKNNSEVEGKGLAIAGIVMGFLAMVPAVLFVLIGTMAFFGVLNPNVMVPEKCTMSTGISCKDYAFYGTGAASIAFENNMGKSIQVTDVKVMDYRTGDIKCTTSTLTPIEMVNGSEVTFDFQGCNFRDSGKKDKVNLEIHYYFANTSPEFTQVVNGEVLTEVQ